MSFELIGLILLVVADSYHAEKATYITHIISNKEVVRTHNELRARVGTPPLTGDFSLSIKAKNCAEAMIRDDKVDILKHPCEPGKKDNQGENIFALRVSGETYKQAISIYDRGFQVWESEEKDIDFSDPLWEFKLDSKSTSKPVFHYTQLVWRSTTRVGCGLATKLDNIKREYKSIVVCRYSPKGNTATVSSIQANVPVPPQPSTSCEDNEQFATSLCADLSVCDSFGNMCKKSCGLC